MNPPLLKSPPSSQSLDLNVTQPITPPPVEPGHHAPTADQPPLIRASTGSYASLFYFMDGRQRYICILAFIFSCAQGTVFPIYLFIFGRMIDSFTITTTDEEMNSEMNRILYMLLYLGAGLMVVAISGSFLWNWLSLQQNAYIKRIYFQKLLAQSASWHDRMQTDKLSANFIDQVGTLTSIFNERFNMLIANFSTTVAGVVVCFIQGWQLALLIFPFLPLLLIGYVFFLRYTEQGKMKEEEAYGEAGSGVEEAFAFIKTVKSCNGEAHEVRRFAGRIRDTERVAIRYGWITAFLWGLLYNFTTCIYGFAGFISVQVIQRGWWNHIWERAYTVGDFVTISIAMTAGTFFWPRLDQCSRRSGTPRWQSSLLRPLCDR